MPVSTSMEHQEAGTRMVRVFVIDDHDAFRSLVATVVDAADGFELAGTAADSAGFFDALGAAGDGAALGVAEGIVSGSSASGGIVDLVLLDVHLGEENGIDVCRRICEVAPECAVVLISTMAGDELPPGAVESGARGFVPKSRVSPSALSDAWRGVYDW